MQRTWIVLLSGLLLATTACSSAPERESHQQGDQAPVTLGIDKLLEKPDTYIKSRPFAVVAHNASRTGAGTHSVDALIAAGQRPQFIFAPEHGFRGTAAAGAQVADGKDKATGLPIVSLYGSSKRPSAAQLADVDVILYDLQDVGARFYTYLSTLLYVMEACAEHDKALIVLDRPNPNGWYCDGPMLQPQHKSFVGALEIPMVHGMTMGEMAAYINNRKLLRGGRSCDLQIVNMDGYHHAMRWKDTGLAWHSPSPNLRTPLAAQWYPALCWFEGTVVSCGRGSAAPFEQVGMPMHRAIQKQIVLDSVSRRDTTLFRVHDHNWQPTFYTPNLSHVKFTGEKCFGLRAQDAPQDGRRAMLTGLHLLLNFHKEYHEYLHRAGGGTPFFLANGFFEKLAGTDQLREQVKNQLPEEEIYESWQPKLNAFRKERQAFKRYPL